MVSLPITGVYVIIIYSVILCQIIASTNCILKSRLLMMQVHRNSRTLLIMCVLSSQLMITCNNLYTNKIVYWLAVNETMDKGV